MKKIAWIFLFLFGFLGHAQEQQECKFLYYGDKAVLLTPPEGWVLDCEAGLGSHIPAVLYKEGGSWVNSETVMYINFESLEIQDQESLEELMSYDEEQFRSAYRGIKIEEKEDVEIGKYNGVLKYFGGGDYPNYEYLTYLDVETFAIMMVISSKSKDSLKKYYPEYLKALNSIRIIKLERSYKE